MSIKIDINPGLSSFPTIDLKKVREFQGNLKDLSQTNYDKMKKALLEKGLLTEFYIWVDPSDNKPYLMDGHQRRRVWIAEGFDPQKVPYAVCPGENRKEAKENLLIISSQFGTITQEGYDRFAHDLPEDWKKMTLNFDQLWREFKPAFKNEDIHVGEKKKRKPSNVDDSYTTYKVIMLKQNKSIIEEKIRAAKLNDSIESDEDALMFIINN